MNVETGPALWRSAKKVARAFAALAFSDEDEVERRAPRARRQLISVFTDSKRDLFAWASRHSTVSVLPQGERRSLGRAIPMFSAAVLGIILVWSLLACCLVFWWVWYIAAGSDGD